VDADLDTLASALYVTIDDLRKQAPQLVPWRPQVGIPPKLSDADLVTPAVMQALLGFTSEARWLRYAGRHLVKRPDRPVLGHALAESLFASLKGECLDQQPWPTRAAARRAPHHSRRVRVSRRAYPSQRHATIWVHQASMEINGVRDGSDPSAVGGGGDRGPGGDRGRPADLRRRPEPSDLGTIVAELAALPLADSVNAACGVKAAARIAYMLKRGTPEYRLGVAATFLPDMSAEGIKDAYGSMHVMHRQPRSARSFLDRLRDSGGRRRSEIVHEGARFTPYEELGVPGVLVGGLASERAVEVDSEQWWIADPTHPAKFANHFSLMVKWGEPMVVDPSYDKRKTLSMAEWKERQNYPDAVLMLADLGGPFRFDLETMSGGQLARLARVLEIHEDSSRPEMAGHLESLSPRRRKDVLSRFFHLPPASRVPELPDANEDSFYEQYARQMGRYILSDTRPYTNSDGEIGLTLRRAIERVAPLVKYETWLRETDEPRQP
jgi:hypothetical protein